MFTVRDYEPRDESGWVRCRVLSFLDSAFFDAVEREKERYERSSIELVAEADGEVVGLLDLEYGRLAKALAHYTGPEPEKIKQQYARVHDDVLYEKRL